MNAIGQFGRFITEYQNPIQIVLIILLLAAAAYAIVKALTNARKKREILAKINETVIEINTAVNNLNEKKADVIYIDNRVPGQAPYSEKAPFSQEDSVEDAPQSGNENGAAQESREDQEIFTKEEEIQEEAAETAIGDCSGEPERESHGDEETEAPGFLEAELPKKYFSRDCAISKNGRTYTIEELNQQIKE